MTKQEQLLAIIIIIISYNFFLPFTYLIDPIYVLT